MDFLYKFSRFARIMHRGFLFILCFFFLLHFLVCLSWESYERGLQQHRNCAIITQLLGFIFAFKDHSNSNFIFICCSLSAAFSYGIASMAMVFINKAVLMQYAYSMTLLTVQVLLSKYVVFELLFC